VNAPEARDNLEMVERIVAASTRDLSLCNVGAFFVIWGLFGGSVDLLFDLIRHGVLPATALWAEAPFLVIAIVASVFYGRRLDRSKDRFTFLHREFLNVLWVTLGVAIVATVGAWRVFPGFASGAIWTVASSIVLFFIAVHGNRIALIGGLVLIASLVAANFMRGVEGYVLAAGFFIGYAGFGLTEILSRD
jgi:hypothetical protein